MILVGVLIVTVSAALTVFAKNMSKRSDAEDTKTNDDLISITKLC